MQPSNWVVAIALLTIAVMKIFWGLDMIVTSHLYHGRRLRRLFHDGVLWLGWFMLITGPILYGALGFLLLRRPSEFTPGWFAGPMLIATFDVIMAWIFLGSRARSDVVRELYRDDATAAD